MKLLLWVYGGGDVYTQMAVDEAMLIHTMYTGEAILRLYWIEPGAVTIGYFQKLEEAIDLEEAHKLGVHYTRRITGGGSVYHDPQGEITYAITVPEKLLEEYTVDESFRVLAGFLVKTIELLGLEARFEGLNDIVVKGFKVSGNAQARKNGAILQHGTLLYASNLEIMMRVLKVPKGKGRRVATRVSTLSKLLGRRLSRDEVLKKIIEAAKQYFSSKKLGLTVVEDTVDKRILTIADALKWKYKAAEWIRLR